MSRLTVRTSLAIAILAAPLAVAQTQRSGGEAQKFMQQYQQLAGEKTALQTQLAQMKKDLDAAQTQLAAVKRERDVAKARPAGPSPAVMAQLAAGKETADKNLEQYKQRLTELVARFRETATNLKEVEADRTKLQGDLRDRASAYDKCAEDNLALFDLNGEILDRLDHVGLFTKVSAEEPFTRITRTRLDNLVVEYRARALQLRAAKPPAP